MVIFVFLRNVWATVIPSLALPFSIIGTFSVMYFLNYSLDNLSMMALILSVGFVVDDAIVMLENIYRHVEMGEDPLEASLVGSREIGFTIVSMTLSLAAVFIPVLFMGGVLGRLFREFAVTICVAILISGVVSVTLTPMLCSRFLKAAGGRGRGGRPAPLYGEGTGVSPGGPRAPPRAPRMVGRPPRPWGVSSACWRGGGGWFLSGPKRFFSDYGASRVFRGPPSPPKDPPKEARGNIGSGGGNLKTGGKLWGGCYPTGATRVDDPRRAEPRPDRRHAEAAEASGKSWSATSSKRLRPQLDKVTGMQVYMQNPPTIRIGAQVSKSLYQYSMQSPDKNALYDAARKLERRSPSCRVCRT